MKGLGSYLGFGGGSNIGIEDMTIGVSGKGMDDYADMLKIKILEEMKTELENQKEAIVKSVQNGWRGKSEERFEKLLDDEIDKIIEDLEREYADLAGKLHDTSKYYVDQDEKLADTMYAGGK